MIRCWKILLLDEKHRILAIIVQKTVFDSRSSVFALTQWRLDYTSSWNFFEWYFVLIYIKFLNVSFFVEILSDYSENFVSQRTRYHNIRISITKICDRLITVQILNIVWCLSLCQTVSSFLPYNTAILQTIRRRTLVAWKKLCIYNIYRGIDNIEISM